MNTFLDQIFTACQRTYYELQAEGKDVTADKIKQRVCCTGEKKPLTMKEITDLFIDDYEDMVKAKGSGKESLFRYRVVQSRVMDFIKKEYGVKNMTLDSIDKRFLDKFYLWLRTEHGNANNTAVKVMQKLASIFKMDRDNGWIQRNPFAQVKLHLDPVDRSYLSKEELDIIYNKEFTSKRLEAVRDMFIFCCYTGLAYIDMKQLTYEEIVEKQDGKKWIVTHRQKTKTNVNVPLLDIPLMLIEKYEGQGKDGHVFPVLSNQKMNDYIKEIIAICNIDKEITCHSARHREFYKHQIINRLYCSLIKGGNDKETSKLLYSTLFCHFKEPLFNFAKILFSKQKDKYLSTFLLVIHERYLFRGISFLNASHLYLKI